MDLHDRTGRRGFFQSLLGEVSGFVRGFRDEPRPGVAELAKLPEESIARIRPELRNGVEIVEEAGDFIARGGGGPEPVIRLFRADPENRFVIERFTGRQTLGEVSAELAALPSWDAEAAFLRVRALFLCLVSHDLCAPAREGG